MYKLASYILRGPKEAIMLAFLFASIPMLFWLSAAIIALVILSVGITHGLKIFFWSSIPAVAWAVIGHYNAIVVLLIVTLFAYILKTTTSWSKLLIALVPIGLIVTGCIFFTMNDILTQTANIAAGLIDQMLSKNMIDSIKAQSSLNEVLYYGIGGGYAWLIILLSLIATLLARYMQSIVYSPGKFGEEFRNLTLTPVYSMTLFIFTLLGVAISPILASTILITSLPLAISALAMIHGIVYQKKSGNFWLVGTYFLLLFMTQIMYPALLFAACLDSIFKFRTLQHK